MDFHKDSPIWKQIAQHLAEGIVRGTWAEGDRIPSVRDLAAELGVNPNTVVRSYGYLEESGAVENQRGLGYSVQRGAQERLRSLLRQEFLSKELPLLKEKLRLLGFTRADWEGLWS